MQITLRSQMIAGTAAVVGASAIALTPVAPAVNIPALSAVKAEVALTTIANPLVALLQTGGLLLNYALKPGAPTPADWQFANIGPVTNGVLQLSAIPLGGGVYRYLPGISNVGLIPNIIANPFPVLSQLAANWVGYAGLGIGAAVGVLAAAAGIVWAPVGLTIGIVTDILSGNIANIPVRIQQTITDIVGDVTAAINGVVNTATVIGTSIINNATTLATAIIGSAAGLIPVVTAQIGLVANSVQTVITNVTAALAVFDIEGAWNAAINGLLGPSGVPGTVINLTLGAGIQVSPDVGPPPTPGTLVPSTRTVLQTLQNEVAGVLRGETPAPAATAAAARRAASVKAPAAAVTADSTADATPSASTARSEATEDSTPSASEAASGATADSSTAGDNDASSAGESSKAGAGASR